MLSAQHSVIDCCCLASVLTLTSSCHSVVRTIHVWFRCSTACWSIASPPARGGNWNGVSAISTPAFLYSSSRFLFSFFSPPLLFSSPDSFPIPRFFFFLAHLHSSFSFFLSSLSFITMAASALLRSRVKRPSYLSKLAKPEDLVPLFPNGSYIGWSGFTGVGYPKYVIMILHPSKRDETG